MAFSRSNPKSTAVYESWSGKIEVTGYNPAYESLLLKTEDGDEQWAKMDTKDDSELNKGDVATVKLTRKEGTKSWFIKEVTLTSQKAEQEQKTTTKTETKSNPKEKKENSYETGQAHGNYRNIIGNFIVQMVINKEYPTVAELYAFNDALKIAEDNYFNGTVIEIQDQTTEKADEVPDKDVADAIESVRADTKQAETDAKPNPDKQSSGVPKGVKFGG